MPRYYFHLYDEIETRDLEGLELLDLASARLIARQELRRLHALQAPESVRMSDHIEIADEGGHVLDSVCHADLL